MAAKKGKEEAAEGAAPAEGEGNGKQGQGRAVVLPNGQRRIDYIREQYYGQNVSRSDIKKNINTMLEEAGRKDEQIPYQIVFAATKTKEDPRTKEAAAAEGKSGPAGDADASAKGEDKK